jgi:hypothetical protein
LLFSTPHPTLPQCQPARNGYLALVGQETIAAFRLGGHLQGHLLPVLALPFTHIFFCFPNVFPDHPENEYLERLPLHRQVGFSLTASLQDADLRLGPPVVETTGYNTVPLQGTWNPEGVVS